MIENVFSTAQLIVFVDQRNVVTPHEGIGAINSVAEYYIHKELLTIEVMVLRRSYLHEIESGRQKTRLENNFRTQYIRESHVMRSSTVR